LQVSSQLEYISNEEEELGLERMKVIARQIKRISNLDNGSVARYVRDT
jgi:hypothetical protein